MGWFEHPPLVCTPLVDIYRVLDTFILANNFFPIDNFINIQRALNNFFLITATTILFVLFIEIFSGFQLHLVFLISNSTRVGNTPVFRPHKIIRTGVLKFARCIFILTRVLF